MSRIVLITLALGVLGCGESPLPEPDSHGAAVLRARCGGCHRLFAPGSMTASMWQVQVERMRGEFARRGVPWLDPADERALLEYLAAHAGTG